MRRYVSIILFFLLFFSVTVPAFAAEAPDVSEPEVEVSEPVSEPETSEPETSEPETSEPETSEPEPEAPLPSTTIVNLDGATVNVSDESISAIADAVTYATTNSGSTAMTCDYEVVPGVYIPSDFVHNRKTVVTYGTSYTGDPVWSIEPLGGEFRVRYEPDSYWKTWIKAQFNPGYNSYNIYHGSYSYSSGGSVTYQANSSVGGTISDQLLDDPIKWSNFDVYDLDGNLVHAADFDAFPVPMVTYVTGFDDLVVDKQPASSYTLPELEYEGYEFDGWYYDEDYSLPVLSGTALSQNTTIYAKFIPYRTISFVTGVDDYTLDSVQVLSGDAYTVPPFFCEGYEYLGAFYSEDYERQFVDGTIVLEDITLYLNFEPIVYNMGVLLSRTNVILTAMLFLMSIWTAVYVWKTLIGR